jgi:hypothetical protein
MFQERRALLDRIQSFESSARYFNDDRRARVLDATDRHMAYAKARLEHIDSMIASADARPYA